MTHKVDVSAQNYDCFWRVLSLVIHQDVFKYMTVKSDFMNSLKDCV